MAESVETESLHLRTTAKRKLLTETQLTQPTTNQCHFLVKKRRRVVQPIQPLTLFGMAGSLTNI